MSVLRNYGLLLIIFAFGSCKGTVHRIKPGETLSRVASANNIDLERLLWVNRLQYPFTLGSGDEVFIPGKDAPEKKISAGPVIEKKTTKPKTPIQKLKRDRPKPKGTAPSITEEAGQDNRANEITLVYPLRSPGNILKEYGDDGGITHHGIDLGATEGTEIIAADNGKVIYSDDEIRDYGNLIIIKHAGLFTTVYAHNQKNLVQVGDIVTRGETIATVGKTGNAETPHLHFELRKGVRSLDPTKYLTKMAAIVIKSDNYLAIALPILVIFSL